MLKLNTSKRIWSLRNVICLPTISRCVNMHTKMAYLYDTQKREISDVVFICVSDQRGTVYTCGYSYVDRCGLYISLTDKARSQLISDLTEDLTQAELQVRGSPENLEPEVDEDQLVPASQGVQCDTPTQQVNSTIVSAHRMNHPCSSKYINHACESFR